MSDVEDVEAALLTFLQYANSWALFTIADPWGLRARGLDNGGSCDSENTPQRKSSSILGVSFDGSTSRGIPKVARSRGRLSKIACKDIRLTSTHPPLISPLPHATPALCLSAARL